MFAENPVVMLAHPQHAQFKIHGYPSGLGLSIASSISPLRAARILTLTDFHKISRAEGPTRQYKGRPF